MHEIPLQQALLIRHSTRRFQKRALDKDLLSKFSDLVDSVEALVPQNRFSAPLIKWDDTLDAVKVLGGYGRIVTPPHILAPYVVGGIAPLTDLGYRVQQMVIHMTSMGIDTCYLGSIKRQKEVIEQLALPPEAHIGAFLAFGYAAKNPLGQSFNALFRSAASGNQRLPLEKLFFQQDFDHPGQPPSFLLPHIEAARWSPSAINAQPWRFLWRDGKLTIFVTRENPRYGDVDGQEYRLFDGGICLANLAISLRTAHLAFKWEFCEDDQGAHPQNLQPLAILGVSSWKDKS